MYLFDTENSGHLDTRVAVLLARKPEKWRQSDKKIAKYRDAIFEIPVVAAIKFYFQTVCLTGRLTHSQSITSIVYLCYFLRIAGSVKNSMK